VVQVTATLVMLDTATVPDPFATAQNCPVGCESTVTA